MNEPIPWPMMARYKKKKRRDVKMKKIEIKGLFSDWVEVDEQRAKKYVKMLKRGMTNLDDADKNEYINSKRLRGITVEAL